MLRNLSLFGGLLAVAACFPDLSQYEGEGDAGTPSTSGSTAAGTPTSSTGSTASTAASTPTTSTSTAGDGGGGAGNPTAGGDATSNGGATSSSSTDSSSSAGGGGGAVDPCLAPIDGNYIQDGVLVAGNSDKQDYAFCIDRAEVTLQAYRRFYDDAAETSFDLEVVYGAHEACWWKEPTVEALVPGLVNIPVGEWNNPTPGGNGERPVVEVDFCDAAAYCAWSGKRLCGGINGDALVYTQAQRRNEWYLACSNNGERLYPYNGDDEFPDVDANECIADPEPPCAAFQADRCNAADDCDNWNDLWTETNPESADCAGVDPRLVNLSGNVMEWVDACESFTPGAGGGPDADYRCETRGGACPTTVYSICDWPGQSGETDAASRALYVGFRCCWDPEEG